MRFPFWARGMRAVAPPPPPPPPPEGSFTASLTNSAATVQQGGSVQRTISIVRTSYTETITPVAVGLPSGVTASFSPSTSTGTNSSITMTLSATGGASLVTADAYTITLTGAGVDPVVLNGTVTVTAPVSGQLPAGHFEPAKMPMTLVYPRPDAETYVHARHRKAYPGIPNRIPLAVQGGAYPFIYEILAGPAGATIGATYADEEYGVWSWTPSGNGTAQTVTVRVTDQEGAFVDATWTITADTASFVFLDPATPTSGTGTISSPYKTWPDVFGTVSTNANNADKVLVLRGGTHTMVGFSANSGNLAMVGYNKPMGWMTYPGESATVNCSTAAVNFNNANDGRDFFAQGFTVTDSRPDLANSRFFFFGSQAGVRCTWHEVSFRNSVLGTAGNDNPGCIVTFVGTPVFYHDYFAVVGCDAAQHAGTVVGPLYAVRYGVVEGCDIGLGSVALVDYAAIFAKSTNTLLSIRNNRMIGQDYELSPLKQQFSRHSPVYTQAQQVEYCYNVSVQANPAALNRQGSICLNNATGVGETGWSVWVYRNTLVGQIDNTDVAGTLWRGYLDRNVVVTPDNPIWSSSVMPEAVMLADNLSTTPAAISTLVDPATYLLTGTARTNHLGRRGHEIAGA